jgi:hypothetical protein
MRRVMLRSQALNRIRLCSLSCDLAAFLCAAAAGLGAATAVVIVVLFTFDCAGFADLGAYTTNSCVKARAAAHECGARPARVGAVDAKACALRHLAETGVAAVFAFLRAAHARVNTGLVDFVGHGLVPFVLLLVCR